jgi:poly(hydroxyalkanoate) depolymerase family esterase
MRRLAQLAAAVAIVTVTVPPALHADAAAKRAGSFTRHTFAATGELPARDYWLKLPAGKSRSPRPLVVFLHGCNVTAEFSARAYGYNDLADAVGFVAVYPQQSVTEGSSAPLADGNGIGCWNWFLPTDQERDAGEPGTIAAITREVMATQDIDPDRVYVAGVSAGADMAVILGANYPDLYASVAALAGCAFRACGDAAGVLTNNAMGERARVVPMFVENGSADTLNNMAMASGLVTSWLGAADLADGGPDGSIDAVPDAHDTYATDQTPQPGSGDLCIHNNTLTCPGGAIGFQGSYPYTVLRYDDASGCDVLDFWVIHGMEHAYPNTPGDGAYTDPLGPDVTTATWNFFASHPMTGGCG